MNTKYEIMTEFVINSDKYTDVESESFVMVRERFKPSINNERSSIDDLIHAFSYKGIKIEKEKSQQLYSEDKYILKTDLTNKVEKKVLQYILKNDELEISLNDYSTKQLSRTMGEPITQEEGITVTAMYFGNNKIAGKSLLKKVEAIMREVYDADYIPKILKQRQKNKNEEEARSRERTLRKMLPTSGKNTAADKAIRHRNKILQKEHQSLINRNRRRH
ncbi:MAG: hypothetical protein ABIB43_05790 [archaeon]